jgi:3-dehydroquinate synthase
VADTAVLGTLPPREYASGLAEVAKYGAIWDLEFLRWIEDHADALVQRDAAALAHAVRRSCEIKAEVVALDERESGARALLNFGHTFGHAIESALGYGEWFHGEAVAAGMAMAARFSARLGRITTADAARFERLLVRLGLPTAPPEIALDRWLEFMGRDKKNEAGRITFILLDALGKAAIVKGAPQDELEALLASS